MSQYTIRLGVPIYLMIQREVAVQIVTKSPGIATGVHALSRLASTQQAEKARITSHFASTPQRAPGDSLIFPHTVPWTRQVMESLTHRPNMWVPVCLDVMIKIMRIYMSCMSLPKGVKT